MPGMGGGSQPSQYAVTTGPTVQASNAAANAQINAAQMAAQAATQNTQSAIMALMGEYSTALTYAQPSVNTGNQALAQLNYMLGLPAVSPGMAPKAPKAVDMSDPNYAATQTTTFQNLAQQAQYLAQKNNLGKADWASPSGQAAGIASVANQLAGSTDPTAAGFTSAYQMAGGTLGGSGASLVQTMGKNLLDPLVRQNQVDQGIYDQQAAQYAQQKDVYDTYAAKGQLAPEQLTTQIQNMPGYQFQLNQGISGIQNAASASGQLNSGALLRQLDQFGQGIASQYYNNYLGQLSNLAGFGQQASQVAQQGALNTGNNIAGLYGNLGNTQANAYLAAGQAQASSFLNPAQNQQVISTGIGSGGGGGMGSALGSAAGLLGSLSSFF